MIVVDFDGAPLMVFAYINDGCTIGNVVHLDAQLEFPPPSYRDAFLRT